MANTLDIALSGLKTATSAISNQSHNIANASTDGYTKKNVITQTQILDGSGGGVISSIPQRIVSEVLIADEREKISSSSYLATKGTALNSIQMSMGRPGEKNSLSEMIKDFSTKCEALSLESTSGIKRKEVLRTLETITNEMSFLTQKIQKTRQSSEAAIKISVDEINANVKEVDSLNHQIIANSRAAIAKDDLVDQRDRAIRNIAKHMDVHVIQEDNGGVFLRMGSGISLLFPSPVQVDFTPTTFINAENQYDPNPALSGVNHITMSDDNGNILNITDYFNGGEIAGHLDIRDRALTNVQAQLDLLATEFRDKINADHNLGSGYPPATTLTGSRTFATPGTDQFQGTGTIRIAIIDKSNGEFVSVPPYDLDLDALGSVSINDLATNINGGLGIGGSAVVNGEGRLVLSATDPNHGIALVPVGGDATETGTGTGLGFSHYFGLNDLITSQNHVYSAGPITHGLAGMLAVHQDIATNDSLLSRGQISDTLPTPAPGDQAIYNGDSRLMQKLTTTLETPQSFVNTGGLGDRQLSFADYSSAIISDSARQALNTENLAKKEEAALNNITYAQGQISGVDTQESLLDILEWQRVYMGCSTVIGIEKDNFNFLMQII